MLFSTVFHCRCANFNYIKIPCNPGIYYRTNRPVEGSLKNLTTVDNIFSPLWWKLSWGLNSKQHTYKYLEYNSFARPSRLLNSLLYWNVCMQSFLLNCPLQCLTHMRHFLDVRSKSERGTFLILSPGNSGFVWHSFFCLWRCSWNQFLFALSFAKVEAADLKCNWVFKNYKMSTIRSIENYTPYTHHLHLTDNNTLQY